MGDRVEGRGRGRFVWEEVKGKKEFEWEIFLVSFCGGVLLGFMFLEGGTLGVFYLIS